MATTGIKFPTSAASVAESPWSGTAWSSPDNTYELNSGDTTTTVFSGGAGSELLKVSGFDFSAVPDHATISGVIVRLPDAWCTSDDAAIALVQLLDSTGAKVGDNKASTPVPLSVVDTADYQFGSDSDLWGNALTPTWVKDADFGVVVGTVSLGGNDGVRLDTVTVEIFYTFIPRTYYVVYESTATDPANDIDGYAQIIAGNDGDDNPAVASGWVVAPTTDEVDEYLTLITGLTPGTLYTAAVVWWDGVSDYGSGRILANYRLIYFLTDATYKPGSITSSGFIGRVTAS